MDKSTLVTEAPPVLAISAAKGAKALKVDELPNIMTLKKIAAATLSYERNSMASGMRSGRSGLLAIIIPDITNPFWAEVTRGAQDRAIREGYSLLVFSSD